MEKVNASELVWGVLNLNLFFVRDAVKRSALKTSDKFDVFDPATEQAVLECGEPEIGGLTKMRRAIGGDHDAGAPFDYIAKVPTTGEQALRLTRGSTSLTMGNVRIDLHNHSNEHIGSFKKKVFALGTKFSFTGSREISPFICQLKSNLLGSEFKLLIRDKEIARRTSSWKASHERFYKEGKFNYAISIAPEVPANEPLRQFLLAFFIGLDRIRN